MCWAIPTRELGFDGGFVSLETGDGADGGAPEACSICGAGAAGSGTVTGAGGAGDAD